MQTGVLEEEVSELRQNQFHQREILKADRVLSRNERRKVLRKARRRFRTKREELEKLLLEEKRLMRVAQSKLETGRRSLEDFDEQFVMSLDEEQIVFYATERFKNNQEGVDSLLFSYCRKNATDEFGLKTKLHLRNFSLISLKRHIDETINLAGQRTELNYQAFWRQADEATARHLKMAGLSR